MSDAWDVPPEESDRRKLRGRGVARLVVSDWYTAPAYRVRTRRSRDEIEAAEQRYAAWKRGACHEYEPGA